MFPSGSVLLAADVPAEAIVWAIHKCTDVHDEVEYIVDRRRLRRVRVLERFPHRPFEATPESHSARRRADRGNSQELAEPRTRNPKAALRRPPHPARARLICREGTVNLGNIWLATRRARGMRHGGLGCVAAAAAFRPDFEGPCPGSSVFGGGDVVSTQMEEVVDLVMGREEALGLAGRLEPLHPPLASSGRLTRGLGSVVQALVRPVLDPRHDLLLRRPTAGKLIGDHGARRPHLLLHQLPKQPLGSLLVVSPLHKQVEHHSALVHGAP